MKLDKDSLLVKSADLTADSHNMKADAHVDIGLSGKYYSVGGTHEDSMRGFKAV